MKRMDVEISRATMADWMIRSSALLEPPYIDRKNWLFAYSVKGARASAILYSLVETAKANGLEPYAWLTYVLKQLPELGPGDSVEYLLPMNLIPVDIRQA